MHLDRKNKKRAWGQATGLYIHTQKGRSPFYLLGLLLIPLPFHPQNYIFPSGMVVALLEEDGINKAMIVLDSQEPFP